MAPTSSRWTSAPVLTGALLVVTLLAAGPLRTLDAMLQGYWAKKYTPNWASFLDSVPNAVAGQAVCLPVLLAVALVLARRYRTWHPLVIVVAAEVAFYVGVGGMKVLLGRSSPAAGEGHFWNGGALEHGWYGIAYPSGHAAEAILFYGAAAYLLRTYAGPDVRIRKRLTFLVGLITANAIVVAFYLGFHWPTDLVGGMLAGGLMLRIIVDLDRRIAAGLPILGWQPPVMRTARSARMAAVAPPEPVIAQVDTPAAPEPVSPARTGPLGPAAHPPLFPRPVRAATAGRRTVTPWLRPMSASGASHDAPIRTRRVRPRELQTTGKN